MNTEDLIARLASEPAAPAFDDRKTMALATLAIAVCAAIFLVARRPAPGPSGRADEPAYPARRR